MEPRSTASADVRSVLAAHLGDPTTSWSVGTFGAIAEFVRDPNEPVAMDGRGGGLSAVTERGGIRVEAVAGMRLVASEGATRESWSQRVALCLPDDGCAMNRRAVLTELGPDAEAIREADRTAALFDLGLDAVQVDACVRVADPGLAEQLRAWCGHPLLAPNNPAAALILAASPHRVFVSRVARAEVFGPIPPADGKSPDGPHTHVLPKLLRLRRTHAATEPVPDGWVPCAHLYPAHPAKHASGAARAYDVRAHDAFQEIMRAFGDARSVDLKMRVMAAVSGGEDPAGFALPEDRFARATLRVTLRQLAAAGDPSPTLAAWQAACDRPRRDELDIEGAGETGH